MDYDIDAICRGDRRALAKAITLIESSRASDENIIQKLLNGILPYTGKSLRLGISGMPGVGKSTFIETFGLYLIKQKLKVAVLAIDPSSPVAGGSILGDKLRMEKLQQHEYAFIRPSPAAGVLGGVAHRTQETILLCEAAGYDVVIVETVGVGQSEYEVSEMVDMFILLVLPNSGDEVQGIKRGIMELAELILVNKADEESVTMARRTLQEYDGALKLLASHHAIPPKVMLSSALKGYYIDDIWQHIQWFRDTSIAQGRWQQRRRSQSYHRMHSLLCTMLENHFFKVSDRVQLCKKLEQQVADYKITPYTAAMKLLQSAYPMPLKKT